MWGVWGGLSRQERLRARGSIAEGWTLRTSSPPIRGVLRPARTLPEEAKERKPRGGKGLPPDPEAADGLDYADAAVTSTAALAA